MASHKSIWMEFKEFIARGSVLDMAVGVIVGGAFTTVVNALVKEIIQPLIAAIGADGTQISGLAVHVNGQTVDFGAFISAIITFLITAAAVFAIVKAVNKMHEVGKQVSRRGGESAAEEPEPRRCPYCRSQIEHDATRCPSCTSKLAGYRNPQEG